MKKALMLSGLFLCAVGVQAADLKPEQIADGKKRNEEAYERMLEDTGWKNKQAQNDVKTDAKGSRQSRSESAQPKSS